MAQVAMKSLYDTNGLLLCIRSKLDQLGSDLLLLIGGEDMFPELGGFIKTQGCGHSASHCRLVLFHVASAGTKARS